SHHLALPATSALSLHDALPISRVQHRQARRPIEARGDHPVVVAGPDRIRIGPVSIEDGVRTVMQLLSSDGVWSASTRSRRSAEQDRKSTRLNSSHVSISYAVFC